MPTEPVDPSVPLKALVGKIIGWVGSVATLYGTFTWGIGATKQLTALKFPVAWLYDIGLCVIFALFCCLFAGTFALLVGVYRWVMRWLFRWENEGLNPYAPFALALIICVWGAFADPPSRAATLWIIFVFLVPALATVYIFRSLWPEDTVHAIAIYFVASLVGGALIYWPAFVFHVMGPVDDPFPNRPLFLAYLGGLIVLVPGKLLYGRVKKWADPKSGPTSA